jgi:propionyl-CoA carboxylase alpha chain
VTTADIHLPRRVLIANRGEIAVRIARTCRSMGIATVAVHSDADAGTLHVEACDEAVRLGGVTPADSYLRGDLILEAARATGADAVHPGYGFLAENATFAREVIAAGLRWIGPSPEVIAVMGDKLEAKRRMADAGVPLIPGAELDADADPDSLHAAGEEVGYPLMIKAAAGGGGKGMRVVHASSELADGVAAARREAARAFGDERVFLERFVVRPRHIEVQVLGDAHGAVVHLFERECSIQRRHQKVVEETPAPGIDAVVREAICAAAVDAAAAIGYVNAGTVEFVADESVLARRRGGEDVDPREAFAFLEVNTRLQVEHPVTEEVVRARDVATGAWERLDLVRLQLLVSSGAPLPFAQEDLAQVGHAIEARLYAEHVAADYRPAPGVVHAYELADGEGVRWDNGVRTGDQVSPYYDPMLAKAVAWAPTRAEAAARLAGTLQRSLLHLTTNRDLLVAVLRDPSFLAGDTTTAFLDERFASPDVRRFDPSDDVVELAVIVATLHAAQRRRATAPVLATLPSGFSNTRPFAHQVRYGLPHRTGTVTVRYRTDGSRDGWWDVQLLADNPAGFLDDDAEVTARHRVYVHAVSEHHLDVEFDHRRRRCRLRAVDQARPDAERWVNVGTADGWVVLTELPRFVIAEPEETVGASLAPMPGSVVGVAVSVGQQVARGELLVTVEAMKMEHRITASFTGVVREVSVGAGDQVDAGATLVVLDALVGDDAGGPAASTV